MKVAFVDTSCLVAIALTERTTVAVQQRLSAFDRLAASPLLEAELRSVLHREGHTAESRVEPWLAALAWATPDRALTAEIDTVLAAGYVRGVDCWHLATALYFSPEPADISFVTLDARQGEVARALGFKR